MTNLGELVGAGGIEEPAVDGAYSGREEFFSFPFKYDRHILHVGEWVRIVEHLVDELTSASFTVVAEVFWGGEEVIVGYVPHWWSEPLVQAQGPVSTDVLVHLLTLHEENYSFHTVLA